jgi:hypothetical protein
MAQGFDDTWTFGLRVVSGERTLMAAGEVRAPLRALHFSVVFVSFMALQSTRRLIVWNGSRLFKRRLTKLLPTSVFH